MSAKKIGYLRIKCTKSYSNMCNLSTRCTVMYQRHIYPYVTFCLEVSLQDFGNTAVGIPLKREERGSKER